MNTNQDSELNLISVYKVIQKNIKLILAVCLINVIIASVILILTKNRYKNTTIFFPTAEQTIDKATVLNDANFRETAIFGPETSIDRLYNIATSHAVQSYVMDKNNLVEHYGYDPDRASSFEKASKKYRKYIKLERTEYNSLELTVEDVDYKLAATIAQDILDKTEELWHKFFKEIRLTLSEDIQNQIYLKDSTVKVWGDSLAKLRDQHNFYGVISPSRDQATIPSAGSINGDAFEKIQNLEEVKEQALLDISEMQSLQNKLVLMMADNSYFLHVLEKPKPSMEKSGPKRTLTVFLVFVVSFILMVFILLMGRTYRSIQKQLNA